MGTEGDISNCSISWEGVSQGAYTRVLHMGILGVRENFDSGGIVISNVKVWPNIVIILPRVRVKHGTGIHLDQVGNNVCGWVV